MECKEGKRQKRPTIEYYRIPASRSSRTVVLKESDDDNNNINDLVIRVNRNLFENTNNNCINRNIRKNQDIPEKLVQSKRQHSNDQRAEKDLDHGHISVGNISSDESPTKASTPHRQISVDLSSLKNVVHRHINVEILSHRLQRQIRVNKFLSCHKPSEVRVLFKAYRNQECSKEEYLNILKIILKDVLTGRDILLGAEFCSILLKKDVCKEKGERLCIQTLLIGLEDLVRDYTNPCVSEEIWKKFMTFLVELFFLIEEEISICSLYLLPLISHALNITSLFIKSF